MDAVLRHTILLDWVTVLFVCILVLLVVAKRLYPNRFLHFIQLLISDKYMVLYGKDNGLLHPFIILTSLVQFLTTSLFIWLVFGVFNFNFFEQTTSGFITIFLDVVGFFLLKILFQKIIAAIFSIDGFITSYIFKKLAYWNFSSLFVLLVNLLLIYTMPTSKIIIYVTILGIIILNFVYWLSVLKIHQKTIISKLFYFILYLCALEIAPYLLIGKLLLHE